MEVPPQLAIKRLFGQSPNFVSKETATLECEQRRYRRDAESGSHLLVEIDVDVAKGDVPSVVGCEPFHYRVGATIRHGAHQGVPRSGTGVPRCEQGGESAKVGSRCRHGARVEDSRIASLVGSAGVAEYASAGVS